MSKYVEGNYEVKRDPAAFEKFKDLEFKLKLVKGIVQNDMTITHRDLERVDSEVQHITSELNKLFEDVLENCVYLGE